MPTHPEVEKIVEEFNKTFSGCDQCQYYSYEASEYIPNWLHTTLTSLISRIEEEEREQFVSLLNSVDVSLVRTGTESDRALLNVKTVWDAIWPDAKARIISFLTNKES